jgi:hypothetical protein
MQCHEFESRLNLLLDERRPLAGDTLLAAHAAGCEPCRQLLAGQQAVLAGLRFGRATRLGPDFAQRVVDRAGEQPLEAVVLADRRPSRRMWAVVIGLVATAAAALIAVSIAAVNSGGDPNLAAGPNRGTGRNRGTGPGSVVVQPRGKDRKVAVATPSRKNDGAANRVVRPGTLSLFGPPAGGYRVAIADVASTLPEAVEKLDEVERYAPGIRRIRVSFTMLIDALWRTIPGAAADEQLDESAWRNAASGSLRV